MKPQATLAAALKRLKSTYSLSERDTAPLNQLFKLDLISIAYTIDGGFDPKTGSYHSESRPVNYKIRAKYFDRESDHQEKMLILMAIRDAEEARLYKKDLNRGVLQELERVR